MPVFRAVGAGVGIGCGSSIVNSTGAAASISQAGNERPWKVRKKSQIRWLWNRLEEGHLPCWIPRRDFVWAVEPEGRHTGLQPKLLWFVSTQKPLILFAPRRGAAGENPLLHLVLRFSHLKTKYYVHSALQQNSGKPDMKIERLWEKIRQTVRQRATNALTCYAANKCFVSRQLLSFDRYRSRINISNGHKVNECRHWQKG